MACILLAGLFTGCRGAIPIPPPWLFMLEHRHEDLEKKRQLPYTVAKAHLHPLPETPKEVELPTIAWVDLNGDFSRHPLSAKSHGYRPSTR